MRRAAIGHPLDRCCYWAERKSPSRASVDLGQPVYVNHGDEPNLARAWVLDPRTDLEAHAVGFEWGYFGDELKQQQLALAILADHLGNDRYALELHREFARRIVMFLPFPSWCLRSFSVCEHIGRLTTIKAKEYEP